MDIQSIPVICVSYNSAELISDLLYSFRKFYDNPIYIIDGSHENFYKDIKSVAEKFKNVNFIHFDYNIHHGPGMAWAINNLNLTGRVLFLDSDIFILNNGFLEALNESLDSTMYGVGMVNNVNEGGFDVTYEKGAIKYLHPACMLCNIDVMRQWPLPLKHGAPMTEAMIALHKAGLSNLLGHASWLINDFTLNSEKIYIRHDWQGTVSRTGGYHLDEWLKDATDSAELQRSILSLVPKNSQRLVEVECSSGGLARAYRGINPSCHYTGIESNEIDARLAKIFCDNILNININKLIEHDFENLQGDDCWIFSHKFDSIENPWDLLKKIRRNIANNGCIVACIPNAQHWSIQAKLSIGDFRYMDSGVLSRSKVRFFTRATIFELFQDSGFKVEQGFPKISSELQNESIISAIKLMAVAVGADPELALQDSLPTQYVIKAIPA